MNAASSAGHDHRDDQRAQRAAGCTGCGWRRAGARTSRWRPPRRRARPGRRRSTRRPGRRPRRPGPARRSGAMPSSSALLERTQALAAADPGQRPVGPARTRSPRQLGDQQVPADGQVDQGGGDVDRVDPLVGHRADVAGPDVADHPELGLPRPGRHELADPGDLAVVARRRPRRGGAAAAGRSRRAPAGRARAPAAAGRPRRRGRPSSGSRPARCAVTAPAGKPMSTPTTSPSPRGPSVKVGVGASSVPAGGGEAGRRSSSGLPAVHFDVAELAPGSAPCARNSVTCALRPCSSRHAAPCRRGRRSPRRRSPCSSARSRWRPLVGTVTVVKRPSVLDRRADGRAAGGRGDVADSVLDVLPVADQVLAGLELLRHLGRRGAVEGDGLL